jgi:hypothetical protein
MTDFCGFSSRHGARPLVGPRVVRPLTPAGEAQSACPWSPAGRVSPLPRGSPLPAPRRSVSGHRRGSPPIDRRDRGERSCSTACPKIASGKPAHQACVPPTGRISGLYIAGALAACATQPTPTAYAPGLLWGLVHGAIAPFSLVAELLRNVPALADSFRNVRVHAFPNSGGWYDFGFLLGLGLVWGGGSAGPSISIEGQI